MSATKEILLAVTGFLNSLSKAFDRYLATRQEAYNIKMDKRKRKAIDYAEQYIIMVQTLGLEKDQKELIKLKTKFFKYNN